MEGINFSNQRASRYITTKSLKTWIFATKNRRGEKLSSSKNFCLLQELFQLLLFSEYIDAYKMTLVKSLNKHFLIILVSVNLSNATHLEGITCDFADEENLVRNLTQELECCNITVQQYYLNWDRGSHYLTTFLNTLQTWECPQFKEECEKETFAYTDFTELVYLTFCERSLMETQCRDDLLQEVEKQSGNLAESFSFTELAQSLNSSEISDGDLIKPCLQVAMLVANEPSSGRFQEIINPLAPLCSSFIWCGFDQNVITSRDISMWTCMPSE